MTQPQYTGKFIPALPPLARDIQNTALWVAERIGTGMDAEDMILLRDRLLAMAEQVEQSELLLFETLCADVGGSGL